MVLDRSGITGPDGASHHGMWDLAMLQFIPGLHLAAPRDGATLREELREAVAINDAPTVIRYPKGSVGEDIPALERCNDGVDVLARTGEPHPKPVSVTCCSLPWALWLEWPGSLPRCLPPRVSSPRWLTRAG